MDIFLYFIIFIYSCQLQLYVIRWNIDRYLTQWSRFDMYVASRDICDDYTYMMKIYMIVLKEDCVVNGRLYDVYSYSGWIKLRNEPY